MKRLTLMTAVLLVLTTITAMAATSSLTPIPKLTLTFTSPKKAITVHSSHPQFMLTLQSNPTTGYSWILDSYNKQLITSVSHTYVAPDSKLMGAPGYEIWTFNVAPAAFAKPQTTKVVMKYARPWMSHQTGSSAVFQINLKK